MPSTRAYAIIGANYGDEGKGAATNWLSKNNPGASVVRFNGGAQAGHTVQLANSQKTRHVFHCYGSGTLQGAGTLYTKDVLVNPVYALAELKELAGKTSSVPRILVPPEAIVTTPWDVAINQFLELGRGANRHGSVGHGINETIVRHLAPGAPKLVVSDLLDETTTLEFTSRIVRWYQYRLEEEYKKGNLEFLPGGLDGALSSDMKTQILLKFYEYRYSLEATSIVCGKHWYLTSNSGLLLFEGAQGLLLDQNNKEHFPHLTRSNTGIQNVVKTCLEQGIALEKVYYVTRPYLTRHGAGPILAGQECSDLWDQGSDKTNKSSRYQGDVRFGKLDWGRLKDRILKDLAHCAGPLPEVSVVVTCMDQLTNQETYDFVCHGEAETFAAEDNDWILERANEVLGFKVSTINGLQG